MINLKNGQLNTSVETILYELKRVAGQYGKHIFTDMKETTDHFMVTCPFHKNGQERKPSCGIHKYTGTYHCFTCGESGNIVKLVKDILELNSYRAAENWLLENFDSNRIIIENDIPELVFSLEEPKNDEIEKPDEITYVSEEELKKYRYYHPYMYERKLTDAIIEKFDVGYDNDFKLEKKDKDGNNILNVKQEKMYDYFGPCITFPVKDLNGNVVFIARRFINMKRFHYPTHIKKPIYGLYEVLKDNPKCDSIVLCESMIDALYFNSILLKMNLPIQCVALNGVGSSYQYDLLRKSTINTIYLLTDMDSAGMDARNKIKAALNDKIFFIDLYLPKNRKDINDCTEEEIRSIINNIKR